MAGRGSSSLAIILLVTLLSIGSCQDDEPVPVDEEIIIPELASNTGEDPCATLNGGCSQTCNSDPDGMFCSCEEYYTLEDDGTTCTEMEAVEEEMIVPEAAVNTGEDPCDTLNGGCSQQCTSDPEGVICTCEEGFTLGADAKTCEEMEAVEEEIIVPELADTTGDDPCDTFNGGCSQICASDTEGAICSCEAGYSLGADAKTCEVIEPTQILKITSILNPPYLMLADKKNVSDANATDVEDVDNEGHMHGNYTGFIIDLLDALMGHVNMAYELYEVPDGQFGHKEGDTWTGMVGEVANGNADVAAGPLTVTLDRDDVVDFTHAFQTFDAVAVFQKRNWAMVPKIESVEDFLENEFKVGVLEGGVIETVIKTSSQELPKDLWENINSHSKGLMESNNAGVKKARWDNEYVYIMEGTSAEWVIRQEPCDLDTMDTGLYKRRYALAVSNQSPLRDTLNKALVEVQLDGTLDELREKWWGEDKCSAAPEIQSSSMFMLLLASFAGWFLQKYN